MNALVGAPPRPSVRGGVLHRADGPPLAVATPEWWAWLESATPATVRVEDTGPPFGLRRERRGAGRFRRGRRGAAQGVPRRVGRAHR